MFTDSPSLPRSGDSTSGSQPHFDSLSLGEPRAAYFIQHFGNCTTTAAAADADTDKNIIAGHLVAWWCSG